MTPASEPLPPETLRAALERVYGQALEPVTECMFTAAAIARGMRVLDVGSGTGDTALRAGGRFVASCYGPLEREPYHAIPIEAVRRRCKLREPFPEYVQAFRVGAADLEQAFDTAGFATVIAHVVPTLRSYSSLAAASDLLRASPSLGRLMSRVPASQRDDTWTEIADAFRAYARPDGLLVPGEQVVVVGTAPGVRTGG